MAPRCEQPALREPEVRAARPHPSVVAVLCLISDYEATTFPVYAMQPPAPSAAGIANDAIVSLVHLSTPYAHLKGENQDVEIFAPPL